MINLREALPYKRILLIFLSGWVIFYTLNSPLLQKGTNVAVADIPEDSITLEGYVVSKRIGGVWIANKPMGTGERLAGYFTGYGVESIYVSKHKEAGDHPMFKDLRLNQKVRVHGDIFRESLPGKTSAYYIEIIEDE
ncbi:YobA family protein [Evansella sp. LMS18]|uniref:DUF3221 domain-containing protein n=1 Tax=Evansella sp. LMS18 TaxID=2924033 RepID=UPI0020D18689|nr:DUF3221 domain-containing protein [Evansella sp. LMS18]UTR08997.1 YobA family protein [Evansella sp. LMS18]